MILYVGITCDHYQLFHALIQLINALLGTCCYYYFSIVFIFSSQLQSSTIIWHPASVRGVAATLSSNTPLDHFQLLCSIKKNLIERAIPVSNCRFSSFDVFDTLYVSCSVYKTAFKLARLHCRIKT